MQIELNSLSVDFIWSTEREYANVTLSRGRGFKRIIKQIGLKNPR